MEPNSNTTHGSITHPAAIAERYFDRWLAGDFDAIRNILSDDASFVGALGTAQGADELVAGLRGMAQILTAVDVGHRWVDGGDVITWYDLHTSVSEPMATVNWMHIAEGRINSIRVTFDPRPMLRDVAPTDTEGAGTDTA